MLYPYTKKQLQDAKVLKESLQKLQIDFQDINHFTVDEAVKVIEVAFPTKLAGMYRGSTSYGFKHKLENLSTIFNPQKLYKYCSNNVVIEAMQRAGFSLKKESPNSPNYFFNVAKKDVRRLQVLISNHAML